MRMFYAKIAIGVLARKAPQVAGYSQGLSRASTCVSLFMGYWVKDELCRRRIRRVRRHAVLHPISDLSEKVFHRVKAVSNHLLLFHHR